MSVRMRRGRPVSPGSRADGRPARLAALAALAALAPCAHADAAGVAHYFVATHGAPDAPGTAAQPFDSIAAAVDRARPGDLIQVRGGRYTPTRPIRITRSGSAARPIRLVAAAGEHVLIDGAALEPGRSVLWLDGAAHWRIGGFEIANGPYSGVLLGDASHCVIERMDIHHMGHTGINMAGESADNLIVDVDSHHNYDRGKAGENADGFGVKHNRGTGNVLRRSRAWANSDDGFDFWESSAVTVEYCWAWANGFDRFGHGRGFAGDGVGFKLGRGPGGHTVIRSAAWGNRLRGFDDNGANAPNTLINNTAWSHKVNFRLRGQAHRLLNNLSHDGRVQLSRKVVEQNNSWNLRLRWPRFASLDDGVATGPRPPGGGLPHSAFLRPLGWSRAIDAGVGTGLDFAGAAPDLGAFEAHVLSDDPPAP